LHNALPEERAKFEISRDRTMIIWDPDKCAINDEVRIADYLAPPRIAEESSEQRDNTRRSQIRRHPPKKRVKAKT
jgi:hypothetical protein